MFCISFSCLLSGTGVDSHADQSHPSRSLSPRRGGGNKSLILKEKQQVQPSLYKFYFNILRSFFFFYCLYLPVRPGRSGLCKGGSSRLQTVGTSPQDVRGTGGQKRRRTDQTDCGGRSSAGGRLSGSSRKLPKFCESKTTMEFIKIRNMMIITLKR